VTGVQTCALPIYDVGVAAAADGGQHLLERVVGVAVILDGDVDLGVRLVEQGSRGGHRLALRIDVPVPEDDVHPPAARPAGAAAAAGGQGERHDERGRE